MVNATGCNFTFLRSPSHPKAILCMQVFTAQITPCSKRKYTLCSPVSTQNVAGAGPPAVLRDSQSEFCNNQATVCEEIPNGSEGPREGLLGCCVRKFTKICFCH